MTSAFDQRIVRVGIEVSGEQFFYESLDIRASGEKRASPSAGICRVQISNLTAPARNFILTKATPLVVPGKTRQPIFMTLDVGRESYGTFRLFQGAVWASGTTQPPDIGIVLESLTNNLSMGITQSAGFAESATIKTIAQHIADRSIPKLKLEFKLEVDRNIQNFRYDGAIGKQIERLAMFGGVNAYIDNDTLVVIDTNKPRTDNVINIDQQSGMIGIPQPFMGGVTVRTLVNSDIQLGSRVAIKSVMNPSVDGEYNVKSIKFDVANREQPFWYNLECANNWSYAGAGGT